MLKMVKPGIWFVYLEGGVCVLGVGDVNPTGDLWDHRHQTVLDVTAVLSWSDTHNPTLQRSTGVIHLLLNCTPVLAYSPIAVVLVLNASWVGENSFKTKMATIVWSPPHTFKLVNGH